LGGGGLPLGTGRHGSSSAGSGWLQEAGYAPGFGGARSSSASQEALDSFSSMQRLQQLWGSRGSL
jgi:hypothetical protein